MARFYGTIRGARGPATRCGTTLSGLAVTAASWQGAVYVTLYTRDDGQDYARVTLEPWRGRGTALYDGPVSGAPAVSDSTPTGETGEDG